MMTEFQLALPVVENDLHFFDDPHGLHISTHTPFARGDRGSCGTMYRFTDFNPHSYLWGVTSAPLQTLLLAVISTHAPPMGSDCRCGGGCEATQDFNPRSPTGSDQQLCVRGGPGAISTLAPPTESGFSGRSDSWQVRYFNPHSPHGE